MNKKVRNDLFLIGILVLLAVGALLWFCLRRQKDNLIVKIYYHQELIQEIELSTLVEPKEYVVEAQNGSVVIIIESDGVFVLSSDCPDQICVHQGKITQSGQTITCLPNRVSIQLVGKDVDISV